MLKNQTINFLDKYNIKIESSLDEQQLIDENIILKMLDLLELTKEDTVLEVGPGSGNITIPLIKQAGFVYAIEKNPKYLPLLFERTKEYKNLKIFEGDVLKTNLPECNKIVSNLPYRISEAFLKKLQWYPFEISSLIVSNSFLKILNAKETEKNYSRLSFEAQLFFNIKKHTKIKPTSYYPNPNTETNLITIQNKKPKNIVDQILKEFLLQRDKKIKNALTEAIIKSHKKHNKVFTKNKSKKLLINRNLRLNLNKRVARLTLKNLLTIQKLLNDLFLVETL